LVWNHRCDRRLIKGFSLIELLAVVALISVIVGMVGPSVSRALGRDTQRKQVMQLSSMLALARVHAMGELHPVRIGLHAQPSGLALTGDIIDYRWLDWQLLWVDKQGESVTELVIVFDIMGRTRTRSLMFVSRDGNAVHRVIDFDPISGVPTVRIDTSS